MAAPRKQGRRPWGVLRAIGRLVLLIGFGFGLGLVVGLVSEEPALVYAHLKGEGETVALVDSPPIIEAPIDLTKEPGSSARDGRDVAVRREVAVDPEAQADRMAPRNESSRVADLPDVAAPPPKQAPAPLPVRSAERAGSKPPVNVADEKRWAIQVGAFSEEATARRLVKVLEEKSYPVAVLPSDGSNRRWRVRVQPLRGEEYARGIANQLKREEGLPTWMVPMEAAPR